MNVGSGDQQRAIRRIAEQLGVHLEAMRNWVRTAEIDAAYDWDFDNRCPHTHRQARGANRELRRASWILKSVSLS
jgi:transposase